MKRSRSFVLMGSAVLLACMACGGAGGEAAPDDDDLTRAQRDSIAARSGLPGAAGVGRAMESRDAANARTSTHDSLLSQ